MCVNMCVCVFFFGQCVPRVMLMRVGRTERKDGNCGFPRIDRPLVLKEIFILLPSWTKKQVGVYKTNVTFEHTFVHKCTLRKKQMKLRRRAVSHSRTMIHVYMY